MAVQNTTVQVSENGEGLRLGFKEAGPVGIKEMGLEQVAHLIVQLDEAANEMHRRRIIQRLRRTSD